MLLDVLSYPTRDEDWVLKILIGGLLSLASFLVFPFFLVFGYQLRVMRHGLEKRNHDLPAFEDWGRLLVDGFLGTLILVLYLILPNLLVVLGASLVVFESLALLVVLMGLVMILAGLYLFPVGLANYVRRGRFSAAFDFPLILRVGGGGEYLRSWLISVVVGIVGGVVSGLLSFFLVGVFITFYFNVCIFYLLGRGFGQSLPRA